MSKIDQAKLALQARKLQKELKKKTIEVESGGGAVVVEISGEMKIKKIYLDSDRIDLNQIEELEEWLEEALNKAIGDSQKAAAETMRPLMGQLGNLGL